MKKLAKNISIFLTFLMILSILSGCVVIKQDSSSKADQKNNDTKVTQPEKKDDDAAKPVELSFCLAQQNWGGSTDPELQEEFKKLLEERTNTKITMIAPPHNSYRDKLNILLTSGDIPDIFHIYTAMSNVPMFARRGYLAELDEYLANSEILNSIYKDIYNKVSVINNKTYAVPDGRNNLIFMMLRKDLLDKYGAAVPSTVDEFYNEMRKLKGTGIIPFTNAKQMSYFRFFFSSFGGYDGIAIDQNGKYYDGFNTPNMKEALKYLNKLYTEQILDNEFLTNQTSTMREKIYSGNAAGSVYWDIYYTTFQVESRKNDPNAEILPVYRLKGPGGDGYTTNWGIDGAFGISSKCKDVERALKVIEWLNTSEGYVAMYSGIKNKHYNIDSDGKIVPTEKAKNSGYNVNVFNYIKFPGKLDLPFSLGKEIEEMADKQKEVTQQGMKYMGPLYVVPSGKSDIYEKVQGSLSSKREEICTKAITGNVSIEEAFKEYEAYWKSIDGDKMLAELNN